MSNSLDASATDIRVEVTLGCGQLAVNVRDDGTGIPGSDFASVGERYHTSKLCTASELERGVASLGFRGEALASVAECSMLEITSKASGRVNFIKYYANQPCLKRQMTAFMSPVQQASGAFETHAKLLSGGRVLKQGLALQQRQRQGTTVCVRDFLFNRPVTRRALLELGCVYAFQVSLASANTALCNSSFSTNHRLRA